MSFTWYIYIYIHLQQPDVFISKDSCWDHPLWRNVVTTYSSFYINCSFLSSCGFNRPQWVNNWLIGKQHLKMLMYSSEKKKYFQWNSMEICPQIPMDYKSAFVYTFKWGNFGRWGNFGQYKTFILSNTSCPWRTIWWWTWKLKVICNL